jgi:hypothetical protein
MNILKDCSFLLFRTICAFSQFYSIECFRKQVKFYKRSIFIFLFTTNYILLVSLVYLIFHLIEIIQKCSGSQFMLLLGKTESKNNKRFPTNNTFKINIDLVVGQFDYINQIETLLANKLTGITA